MQPVRPGHPAARIAGRAGWPAFVVLFYFAGESFTIWILDPGAAAAWRLPLVVLFPVLVPVFLRLRRRTGCPGGHCGRPPASAGLPPPPPG